MIAKEPVYVVDKGPEGEQAIGSVEIVDCFGSDELIANAARTSFDQTSSNEKKNARLIHYLYRNKHTSPFEMGNITFKITAPMFVARQWMRHRTAKINEVSRRYVDEDPEFYLPHEYRPKDPKGNKQGSLQDAWVGDSREFKQLVQQHHEQAFDLYKKMLEAGVAPEQARIHLPLSTMTTWIWQMDIHNLFHFLQLREDSHAQKEIRVFAHKIHDMIRTHLPAFKATLTAFEELQGVEGALWDALNEFKSDIGAVEHALMDLVKEKEEE